MKTIDEYIIERGAAPTSNFKYCINFWVEGRGWDKLLTNNWKKEISNEPISKAKYYDVHDMSKSSFVDVNSLIAWHGKDGYWANVYDDSKDPENAPEWGTVLKGKNLEKIERCKQ